MEDKTNISDQQNEQVSGGNASEERKEHRPVHCPSCKSEDVEYLRTDYKIFGIYRCKKCGAEFKVLV